MATVTVPIRLAIVVFCETDNVVEPGPVYAVFPDVLIQETFDFALQTQVAPVATVVETLVLPPATFADVGAIE